MKCSVITLGLILLLYTNYTQCQVPCDTSMNCCALCCGANAESLCDCMFATGQSLRQQEKFSEAVKYFQAVVKLCPERNAQGIIDSIYREYRIWVYQDGKFAIATALGEVLTPFRFSNPEPFRKGVAIYSIDSKYFFVDKNGLDLTPQPGFDGIIPTNSGLFYVFRGVWHSFTTDKGLFPKVWFYQKAHRPLFFSELIDWDIYSIKSFFESVGKYNSIVLQQFLRGPVLVNTGFSRVSFENRYGIIDNKGQEIFPPLYEDINFFSLYDPVFIKLEGKWGVVDKNKKVISSLLYDDIRYFLGNLIGVKKGNQWGFINSKNGNVITPHQYDEIELTNVDHPELINVKKDKKWGCIDSKTGILTIDLKYNARLDFRDGFASIGRNHFINRSGQEFSYQDYSSVWEFKKGFAVVGLIKKVKGIETSFYGLIDTTGKEICAPQYNQVSDFQEGTARVRIGYKWGLINQKGDEISKLKYALISDFQEGLAIVNTGGGGFSSDDIRLNDVNRIQGGLWGFISISGQEICQINYNQVKRFNGGFAQVRRKNLWGFIDKTGHEICEIKYDELKDFKSGVAWFKKGGLWGLINKSGNEIHPPLFSQVSEFISGISVARSENGWSFIDSNGIRLLKPLATYNDVENFYEGIARVKKVGRWGLIDTTGREICPVQYYAISHFREGMAAVSKDNLWGFIDKNGYEVIPSQYNDVRYFLDGVAIVKKGKKFGQIDKTGNELFLSKFGRDVWLSIGGIEMLMKLDFIGKKGQATTNFRNSNLRVLSMFNDFIKVNIGDKWRLFNKGVEITKNQYDVIGRFAGKFAQVRNNNKWGFIDINGREIVNLQYDVAKDFNEGFAGVKKDGKWGFINENGQEITKFQYDEVKSFSSNFAGVLKGRKWGFIDKNGQEITDFIYDDVKNFVEGFAPVKKDYNWGVINTSGKEISEFQYNTITDFQNKFAWIVEDGRKNIIDTTGHKMIPINLDDYKICAKQKYLIYLNQKKGLFSADKGCYIPPEYDEIANPTDEWVIVMKNGKWGWVDHCGNVQIPCRYDAVTSFNSEGWATVFQFGLQFRINKKGEMILR